MGEETAIHLHAVRFSEAEMSLAGYDGLVATAFRYSTGVAALRIDNDVGHMTVLPFQGQQIWDAYFLGRTLTMKSMFPEPIPTGDYLATYGAFFIHCGASAMGNPGPGDTHPLHGELPNARYGQASLVAGRDAKGAYMGLRGAFRHAIAFHHHYEMRPLLKLHAGSSRIEAEVEIENLRPVPMELMYLAHINFRPAEGGRLIDTVPDDPAHMRIYREPPPGFVASPEHRRLLDQLARSPALHRSIDALGTIDPEVVFSLDCRTAEDGWAHAMQLHPDGTADFVSQRPDQLDHAVRWITRTGDQDALGLLLPATAGPDGYLAAKAKGNVRVLPPGGIFRCSMEFGALDVSEATHMRRAIERTRA